jgi:hypothetical protein
MAPNNPGEVVRQPWIEADFLLSTDSWTPMESLAFRVLLQKNWSRSLPVKTSALAALVGIPVEEFEAAWRSRIRKKFVRTKAGFDNPRVVRDREAALAAKTKARESGRQGGLASTRGRMQSAGAVADRVVTNLGARLKTRGNEPE